MQQKSKYWELIQNTHWENVQIIDLLLGWSAPRLAFLNQIYDPALLNNKAFLDYPYQVMKYYLKVVNYLATRLKFKTSYADNNAFVQLLANGFVQISNDLNKHLVYGSLVNHETNLVATYSQLRDTWCQRLQVNQNLINEILQSKDWGEWIPEQTSATVIKKVVSDSDILSSQPSCDFQCIKVNHQGLIDHLNTDLWGVDNLAFEMLNYQKRWQDLLADINNFEILRTNNYYPDSNDNNFLMYMCSIGELYGLYYWAISMYTKFATALTVNVTLAKSNEQDHVQFEKLAAHYDIDEEALGNLSVKYTSEYCFSQMKLMAEIMQVLKPYLDI